MRCEGCNKTLKDREQVIEVGCLHTYCLDCTQPGVVVGTGLLVPDSQVVQLALA